MRYPRCVKNLNQNHRMKFKASSSSGTTFYSWKNYLNADVDRYYNLIMNRKRN